MYYTKFWTNKLICTPSCAFNDKIALNLLECNKTKAACQLVAWAQQEARSQNPTCLKIWRTRVGWDELWGWCWLIGELNLIPLSNGSQYIFGVGYIALYLFIFSSFCFFFRFLFCLVCVLVPPHSLNPRVHFSNYTNSSSHFVRWLRKCGVQRLRWIVNVVFIHFQFSIYSGFFYWLFSLEAHNIAWIFYLLN